MFKFRFNEENLAENANIDSKYNWFPAEKVDATILIADWSENQLNSQNVVEFICGDTVIRHVCIEYVLESLKANENTEETIKADLAHSDLVTSKYEGGLKIWECTSDLANFILKQPETYFQNQHVLDLGCGAGILGILALIKGATVHFQDYNNTVIKYMTIPNVLLNSVIQAHVEDKCKFFSGDWESFSELTSHEKKFDIILTSETIYNEENYSKLLNLFNRHLTESGTIYVAAKTYYFGVGGGTRQFESLIKSHGIFHSEVVWKLEEGVNREIIQIKRLNMI